MIIQLLMGEYNEGPTPDLRISPDHQKNPPPIFGMGPSKCISDISPFGRAYSRGVRGYLMGGATFVIGEISLWNCKWGGTN